MAIDQLDIDFSRQLRDLGIATAVDHANARVTGWIDYAYSHFEAYLRTMDIGQEFMIEDFRDYLSSRLLEPPSLRAFGAIALRGVKNGRIERTGYAHVKNPIAHRANAAVWKRLN